MVRRRRFGLRTAGAPVRGWKGDPPETWRRLLELHAYIPPAGLLWTHGNHLTKQLLFRFYVTDRQGIAGLDGKPQIQQCAVRTDHHRAGLLRSWVRSRGFFHYEDGNTQADALAPAQLCDSAGL